MATPSWLLDLFASVMVVLSVYSAGRLVAARRWRREMHYDVNTVHALDGAAMAGMLVPALQVLPDVAWEAVFAAMATWFAWSSARVLARRGSASELRAGSHALSHLLTHLTMSCAMLYMFLAAAPPPVRVGAAGEMVMAPPTGTVADFVLLPLAFIVVLSVSAVWHVDALPRLVPGRTGSPGCVRMNGSGAPGAAPGAAGAGQVLAPRLEAGCHVALCIVMGFMLVLML